MAIRIVAPVVCLDGQRVMRLGGVLQRIALVDGDLHRARRNHRE